MVQEVKGEVVANAQVAAEVEKQEDKVKPVSCLGLFAYADCTDVLLMAFGTLCAAGLGATLPLFSVFLGELFTDFQTSDDEAIMEAGAKYAKLFALLALGAFVGGAGQVALFTVSAGRQTLRIRKLYLDSLLKQEVAWFDGTKSGELTAKIAENTAVMRNAIGEKLGTLIQNLTMFVVGFIVGFVYNWKLTLVIMGAAPLLATGGYCMMSVMEKSTSGSLEAYGAAGGIAGEAFSMIRTVASLGAESRIVERFKGKLGAARRFQLRQGFAQGAGMGFTTATYFLCYALAFWFGARLVIDSADDAAVANPPSGEGLCFAGADISPEQAAELRCVTNGYDEEFTFITDADVCRCIACNCGCFAAGANCVEGGDILLVFFSVVIGAFALGQAAPSITALTEGRAAAARVFSTIERVPLVDANENGRKLDSLRGHLRLNKLTFRYPTRPERPVLNKIDLDIKPGETVALVGGSGCGKSTVTQLVQRFYDPEDGSVSVDGVDLRELNVAWWRNNIGLVGQEPVLFATTIASNIAYGAIDGHVPSRAEIEAAAKAANAFNFISELPQGFDTYVGERGSSLSGGQKQRIAIARAMIRDPSILILDEATSALDNESERIVQAALDDLLKQRKRTTIVIAHRLSTVRNATKIVVLGDGGVLEQGPHDELVALGGHYAALVQAAQRSQESGADGEEADVSTLLAEDEELAKRMGSSQLEDVVRPGSRPHSGSRAGSRALSSSAVNTIAEVGDEKTSGKEGEEKKEPLYSVPIRRILKYVPANQRWLFAPGALGAIVNGLTMPLFAILFANIANVYFLPTSELIQESANTYSVYFVAFSLVAAVSNFVQIYTFNIIGAGMTERVRAELFEAMLRQEVGFFDDRSNSVGALTSRLSTDAALVKAAVADKLGLLVANLSTLIAGLTIAFVFGWQLTLVLLALLPLMIASATIQMLVATGVAKEDEAAMSEAAQVLSESVSGIRTVTAFGLRERVVALYDRLLIGPNKLAIKAGVTGGLGFGVSQAVIFVLYSVSFFYGAYLMNNAGYTFQDVITVFFAVVMMGMGIGQTAAMTPDAAKASQAVSSVFQIIDRKSKVDPFSDEGAKAEAQTGDSIELRHVAFTYPSRPDAAIFEDFTLTVPKGSTVALVGQSGSGKSTAIQLLERFYDADKGEVRYHGINTRKANPAWLRGRIGLVSQEPQLFGTTIFDNIAMGVAGSDIVTQEQVEAAAKNANAHDFICGFTDGYQTMVGEQGSQLSGGQKQRVCLARCLIRNPEVLLLDEATSALDNESEKIVQAALDRLMQEGDRTTIVVAHRLSTIQNADLIAVVDHGKIVEQGKHEELLAADGVYAKLYNNQAAKGAEGGEEDQAA